MNKKFRMQLINKNDEDKTFSVYFSNRDRSGTFTVAEPEGELYQEELKYDSGCNIIPGDFDGDEDTDFIRQEKGDRANDNLNTFKIYFSKRDGTFTVQDPPEGFQYQVELNHNIIQIDSYGMHPQIDRGLVVHEEYPDNLTPDSIGLYDLRNKCGIDFRGYNGDYRELHSKLGPYIQNTQFEGPQIENGLLTFRGRGPGICDGILVFPVPSANVN
jgi:hypothetical protein